MIISSENDSSGNNVLPLALLKKADKAIVVDIKRDDIHVAKKLANLGILAGVEIEVLQRFPSFQFQIYNTKYVIDKELASCIFVTRKDGIHECT